ncbi:MAG: hypothetical protein HC830_10980 [Bacteroidetes bacterium]|nr:hypothetical protein [Bacteroidota bacterium]
MNILKNSVEGKKIELKVTNSSVLYDDFKAHANPGKGIVKIESDLGL